MDPQSRVSQGRPLLYATIFFNLFLCHTPLVVQPFQINNLEPITLEAPSIYVVFSYC